jgi:RNA polymerase sigma-70 factor (ECF subfamily)
MNIDEPKLIAYILDGNQEAYATLVDRYKTTTYRHCFYITHDEDTAEDMAQQAFIKAYLNLKKFDPAKASFKTWLFTIATRECLSYLRRQHPLLLEDDGLLPSNTAPTDQLAKDKELYEAVMRLQPRYRTVVTLYYWHNYPYVDIAKAMDVPVGSVRGWLYRAKQQLKEALS